MRNRAIPEGVFAGRFRPGSGGLGVVLVGSESRGIWALICFLVVEAISVDFDTFTRRRRRSLDSVGFLRTFSAGNWYTSESWLWFSVGWK